MKAFPRAADSRLYGEIDKKSYGKRVTRSCKPTPNAEIYVVELVTGNAEIRACEENIIKRMEFGNDNIHFVDTTDWNVEISSDDTHPTTAGYTTMANKLFEILSVAE